MDLMMLSTSDYFPILIAAVLNMVVGFAWYSPMMFAKPWVRLMGFDIKLFAKRKKNMGTMYFLSFAGAILQALVLATAFELLAVSSLQSGWMLGFLFWLGFIFPTQLTGAIFNKDEFNLQLLLINTSYQLTGVIVMSTVLAYWR
jgi:hypothetical protein